MQATRNTSPIAILHEDLLWKIFVEITDDARVPTVIDPRPIVTARHCSQVCRLWRSVLLSSSSIWGRLIDVSVRQETDDWMKEVVRRAGDALLWVYGEMVWHDGRNQFLFAFLQENWRRVEMLFIVDEIPVDSPQLVEQHQKLWTVLREPAPHLRWFSLLLQYWIKPHQLLPARLFADNAPLLTEFHIASMEYKFSTHASWIPNLSGVAFTRVFTAEEVLKALQRMPRLQYLTIYVAFQGDTDSGALAVVLPRLKVLECLYEDFSSAVTILENITPSTDCCLGSASTQYEQLPASDTWDNERYEAAVSKYLVPYFLLHPPSFVVFNFGREVSDFFDGHDHESQQPPTRRLFCISHYTPFLPSFLINNFNGSDCFSQVWNLHLRIMAMDGPIDITQLGIASICSAFPNITTLSTPEVILHSLLLDPSATATLFPALHTLQISDPYHAGHGDESEEPLRRFLRLRAATGRRLSVLEISFTQAPTEFHDMDSLEEHTGLLVKWQFNNADPEEYMCGSGHPERLCFSRKN